MIRANVVRRRCSNKLILPPGKRFEPRIDGLRIGIRKIIVERFCSSFYLLKNTFDWIPIAERFVVEMYAEFEQSGLESRRAVDEELGVSDVVFLIEVAQKQLRDSRISGRKQPEVKDLVRLRIHRPVEPEPLAFDLDHRLIESHLVGTHTIAGLEIRLLYPVVDRRFGLLDAKPSKGEDCIGK